MLILAAAVGIAWYAGSRLLTLHHVDHAGVGTVAALIGALVNLAVAQVLLRVGRRTESITLEADGQHLMTDVWTSLAVVIGLFLVWLTEVQALDPLAGLLAAANIAWTGFGLIRRSFNGLMDHALPEEEQARVRAAIEANLESGLHFHALRTRQAGAHRFADFHLLVPGAWSVQRAHDLTEKIEEAVTAALPGLEVTVHVEPIEEPAAWHDSELLAIEPGPKPNHGDREEAKSEIRMSKSETKPKFE
jgi:cation diffusion facilitator family transporter